MLNEELLQSYQESLQRWTEFEKKLRKRASRRAKKGTNWKSLRAKKGYKRYKLPGTKRYVIMRLNISEKSSKKIMGRKLGLAKHLRK